MKAKKLDPYTLRRAAAEVADMAKSCRDAATIPKKNIRGFPSWARECKQYAEAYDSAAAYLRRMAIRLEKGTTR